VAIFPRKPASQNDFLKVRFEREMFSVQELDHRVRIVASERFGSRRNEEGIAAAAAWSIRANTFIPFFHLS